MKSRIYFVAILFTGTLLFSSCASRRKTAGYEPAPPKPPENTATQLHPVLGIPVPANAQPMLLASIQKWKGTVYRLGGNTSSGIDCSGLIQQVYKETYQLATPRTTADLFLQSTLIPADSLQQGDLVFFSIGTTKPGHAGIYLWNQLFFHASTSKGVMVSSLQEVYWKKYFTAAGRLRKSNAVKP